MVPSAWLPTRIRKRDVRQTVKEREQERVPPELADFTARLESARDQREGRRSAGPRDALSGVGLAWRVSLELVAALAVGGGLGWLLDDGLGTRPWLMALCFMLGGAAGVVNAWRVTRGLDESVGFGQAVRRRKECPRRHERPEG